MSRLALFILACTLFTSVTFTFASPLPVENGELVNLEKRTVGRGTWYQPGMGNCGWESSASDSIVAIGKGLYDRTGGKYCGHGVTVSYQGNTIHATVVDSCQSCTDEDIDMSPGAFQGLAPLSVGLLQVNWYLD